jgi:hypothetical protein
MVDDELEDLPPLDGIAGDEVDEVEPEWEVNACDLASDACDEVSAGENEELEFCDVHIAVEHVSPESGESDADAGTRIQDGFLPMDEEISANLVEDGAVEDDGEPVAALALGELILDTPSDHAGADAGEDEEPIGWNVPWQDCELPPLDGSDDEDTDG